MVMLDGDDNDDDDNILHYWSTTNIKVLLSIILLHEIRVYKVLQSEITGWPEEVCLRAAMIVVDCSCDDVTHEGDDDIYGLYRNDRRGLEHRNIQSTTKLCLTSHYRKDHRQHHSTLFMPSTYVLTYLYPNRYLKTKSYRSSSWVRSW